MTPDEALKPSARLLSKIGSLIVHAEEMVSPDGHFVDATVLTALMNDPEVRNWIAAMGPLLPQKRNTQRTTRAVNPTEERKLPNV